MRLIITFLILFGQTCGFTQIQKFEKELNNPGDLIFYLQSPDLIKSIVEKRYPLVIALHGCNQSAKNYALNSGISVLAIEGQFFLGLPEQRMFNNGSKCFNWYRSKDNEKGKGELASIVAFIDTLVSIYPIDTNKIYITGVSAGAAMSIALLVNYPNKFAGGSPLAGGCYCASDLRDGFRLMRHDDSLSDEFLKSKLPVQDVQLPPIIIIQGLKDNVVDPTSANDIARQWNLSCSDSISSQVEKLNERITINKLFCGENELCQLVNIDELGHAIPISEGCGHEAMFIKDIGFCAMRYIFEKWNLITVH